MQILVQAVHEFKCNFVLHVFFSLSLLIFQSAPTDYIKDPSPEAFDEEIIYNVTAGTIHVTDIAADTVAENACNKAKEDLAATENALEKLAMRFYCEKACDEACGFLVNGLSVLTFLAVLEC